MNKLGTRTTDRERHEVCWDPHKQQPMGNHTLCSRNHSQDVPEEPPNIRPVQGHLGEAIGLNIFTHRPSLPADCAKANDHIGYTKCEDAIPLGRLRIWKIQPHTREDKVVCLTNVNPLDPVPQCDTWSV